LKKENIFTAVEYKCPAKENRGIGDANHYALAENINAANGNDNTTGRKYYAAW
jgi:hypothetical protein